MDKELISNWAKNLTKEEMQESLILLVEEAIYSELLGFSLTPYWTGNGQPLIAGQKAFADE